MRNLPHPVCILDDCPQLDRVIADMEAGTYPLPDDDIPWRTDLPEAKRIRLARACGATDEQIQALLNGATEA